MIIHFHGTLRKVYKNEFIGWFGLLWFYGISNIAGYLMPNSVFTYILNI